MGKSISKLYNAMDFNSRRKEGLKGPGAGVTIIHPDRVVIGISTDYPKFKLYSQDGDAPRFPCEDPERSGAFS